MFLKKNPKLEEEGFGQLCFAACIAKQKSRKYVLIFNFEINNRKHVIQVFSILVQQNIFTIIALVVPQWIGTPVPARLLPTAP